MAEDNIFGQRLLRLEVTDEIRNLIAQYAVAGDRKNDPKIMGRLFTRDGVWESEGFGRFVGANRIAEALADVAEQRILWTLHVMGQPYIEIGSDLDSATAHWVLWEVATMRQDDGDEKDHWIGGFYDTQMREEDGVWRFSEMRLEIPVMSPYEHSFRKR